MENMKMVDNPTMISKSEIKEKFEKKRLLTYEEKEKYVNTERNSLYGIIGMVMFLSVTLFGTYWSSWLIFFTKEDLFFKVGAGIGLAVSSFFDIFLIVWIIGSFIDKKKIREKDIYVYDCKVWDKKVEVDKHKLDNGTRPASYHIKIADENYFVNEWFLIEGLVYNQILKDDYRCRLISYSDGKKNYYRIITIGADIY